MATSHLAIMALADSEITGTDIDQILSRNRVGIVKSYIYPRALQVLLDGYPDSIDSGASSELSLLKMLTVSRFQLAITDPTVLQYLAEKDGTAEIQVVKMLQEAPLVLSMHDTSENQAYIALIKRLLQARDGQRLDTVTCTDVQ
ncbi:MAG: hypothetical protein VW877_04830 [Pseudomonadaceae bacterium]